MGFVNMIGDASVADLIGLYWKRIFVNEMLDCFNGWVTDYVVPGNDGYPSPYSGGER